MNYIQEPLDLLSTGTDKKNCILTIPQSTDYVCRKKNTFGTSCVQVMERLMEVLTPGGDTKARKAACQSKHL